MYVMVMRCIRGDGYMYEDVVVVVVLPDPKTVDFLLILVCSREMYCCMRYRVFGKCVGISVF